MSETLPISNGANGRDGKGRFAKGNPGGPGSPLARRTHEIKSAILNAVTEDDIKVIFAKLLTMAKAGDTTACGLIFDRVLGKASQPIELTSDQPEAAQVSVQAILADPSLMQQAMSLLRRLQPVDTTTSLPRDSVFDALPGAAKVATAAETADL